MIKCISPIDGSVYAERAVLSAADASAGVARAAQAAWAALPLSERIAKVQAGVAAIGDMNDDIVPELAWQMGQILPPQESLIP